MARPRGPLIHFLSLVGDRGEQHPLLPCMAIYDLCEAEPGPFARKRRALVGCVTRRFHNVTVFFDTRFLP
jgi:hypothetical protein